MCGECGTPYKRCTWARNGKKRIVWRCVSRLEFGTKYCHNSPTLDEDKLHRAIVEALNSYGAIRQEVARGQPEPGGAGRGRQRELDEWLARRPMRLTDYDDSITRRMVERITVVDGETIRVKLKNVSMEIEQKLC